MLAGRRMATKDMRFFFRAKPWGLAYELYKALSQRTRPIRSLEYLRSGDLSHVPSPLLVIFNALPHQLSGRFVIYRGPPLPIGRYPRI
jgi:hypothetical protein